MSSPNPISAYLETLFADPPGFIDVRTIDADDQAKRMPVASAEEAFQLASNAGRTNVYVGIATRQTGSTARDAGGKENLEAVRALWVDADFKQPEDESAFAEALETFPHPPSMVVSSGGGRHVYWLLAESFDLTAAANVERFENALKGIADYLGGDFAATDASRILRVPGTMNYPNAKKRAAGRTPAACKLEALDDGRTYSFDDFEALEMRGAQYRRQRVESIEYDAGRFDGSCPAAVTMLLEKKGPKGKPRHPKLVERWLGDVTDLQGNAGDSELDLSIATLLAIQNVEPADIENALRFRRQEYGGKSKHGGYYALTIAKAIAWAKQAGEEHEAQAAAPEQRSDGNLEDATDDGMADRLVRLHGQDVAFVPALGWFVWDRARFRHDTEKAHAVGQLVRQSARQMYHEAADVEDTERRQKLIKTAERVRMRRSASDVVWMLERDPRIIVHPDALDADGYLLNCSNGTLDLRSGELRPHSRADRLTRLAPTPYIEDALCPRWDEWLAEMQPDQEVRDYLQRLGGSALLGVAGKEVVAIHFGFGANGKSTFVEAIRDVLGLDYSAELPAETLVTGKRDGRALELLVGQMPGKRLVTTLEPSASSRLNEAAVKRVTSNERLVGRLLYGQAFEFTPVGTVMAATNHRPRVDGVDDGIWRRIHLVPWRQVVPEGRRDPRFRERLLAGEREGILAWLVRGALLYQVDGLGKPKAVSDASEDYRRESDAVGAFLAECCEVHQGARRQPAGELYEAFRRFAEQNGLGEIASNQFSERLEARGCEKTQSRGRRYWNGVQLIRPDSGED